jgi:hypothetical protein
MDPFFIQLAIVFLPGMIWERVGALAVQKRRPDQFDILRRSFVFGLASYLVTFAAYRLVGLSFQFIELTKDKEILSAAVLTQACVATLVGLLLSIIYTFVVNRKYINRFFRFIGASKRFGDEDVWDYTFSSRSPEVEYVHVRDFTNRIVYTGWVELFSETDKVRELVLKDVQVYDFDGERLFDVPRVYVARAMDKMDIEFPYRGLKGEADVSTDHDQAARHAT